MGLCGDNISFLVPCALSKSGLMNKHIVKQAYPHNKVSVYQYWYGTDKTSKQDFTKFALSRAGLGRAMPARWSRACATPLSKMSPRSAYQKDARGSKEGAASAGESEVGKKGANMPKTKSQLPVTVNVQLTPNPGGTETAARLCVGVCERQRMEMKRQFVFLWTQVEARKKIR